VLLKDTHNCYVRAESKPIAISGLDDLIVIDTPDALLVTRKGQDQQVRQLASSITQQQNAPASPGSDWPKRHKMFTGWGHSITLEQSDTSQVRKVTLLEGHAIQLRAIAETEETWIVQSGLVQFSWETPSGIHTEVLESGTGRVSLTIPRGHNYTIDNLGDGSLEMLAVQSRMDANAADSRYGKHL
jgi:mannose-1-phosphate guanylyltransferase